MIFIYFFVVFIACANIYLKCLNTFYDYKRIFLGIFSLIFALQIAPANEYLKSHLYYLAILLGITCSIFIISAVIMYFKTKDLYSENLSIIINIWEIITFLPIFLFASLNIFHNSFDYYNICFIVILAVFFYLSIMNAIKIPKVKEININSPKIKNELKLVLIADIHLKKNLNEKYFKEMIEEINKLKADFVLIAGDLVDTNIKFLKYLHLINELKSTHGTFFVFGNHEYYHNVNLIFDELKNYNINILDNKTIDFDDCTINGVNDLMGLKIGSFKPDFTKLNPKKEKFNILLTHQPKSTKVYDVSGFDLVLAGHTHAGQVFPFSLAVKLEQGFVHGLYKLKNNLMYVTSGAGFWGFSARILAPSEIVLIKINGI